MKFLARLALILAGALALAYTVHPAADDFDAERWLAEQELVCASLERGGECAP